MTADQSAFALIAVVLAGLRIGGMTHEAFQAVAHIFVTWVFAAWWFGKGRFYLKVGVMLVCVEIVCAAVTIAEHAGLFTR